MIKQEPKHAKPAVFAGDVRRGTVLLTEAGKPMIVYSLDFYASHSEVILTTRVMGATDQETHKVDINAELPLASISTAEFLLWEFSQYSTLESVSHDSRYRGQLAE